MRWPVTYPAAAVHRNSTTLDTSLGWRFPNPKMEQLFPLEPMGATAENLAEQHQMAAGAAFGHEDRVGREVGRGQERRGAIEFFRVELREEWQVGQLGKIGGIIAFHTGEPIGASR